MIIKNTTIYKLILIFIFIVVYVGIDLILAGVLIKNSDRTFRAPHSYYHHGLIPNQKALAQWNGISYPVYTNSLGFRDAEIRNVPLTSSKKRILFMGDSHTEGVGISFSDTFTGQLIIKTDTSKTEILNAAAVSYSPKIYYLKTKYLLDEVGLKFDELFVFIDLSDIQNEIVYENFVTENPGVLIKIILNFKNRAINKSFTLHTISGFMKNYQTKRFLEKAALFDEYRKDGANVDALELYASFFSGFDDNVMLSNPRFHGVSGWLYDENFIEIAKKGLALGKENMMKLYELCKNNGIKMTISVHPWQEQIALMQPEDMYVNFWKDFAEETGAGFINLYPTFINPPVSAALGMEFFIHGDNHWNKNGHWLVANLLNEYFIKTL